MTKNIKVLIVDDSKFIRTLFSGMLSEYKDIEVVDTAGDPYEAREKIKLHNPDVITLDIEMPKMDGIAFLEKLMKLRPMPVIMASTLTLHGADITLRALEMGAFDYIAKPSDSKMFEHIGVIGEELASKIRAAANANLRFSNADYTNKQMSAKLSNEKFDYNKIIAIGASTGGVEAIKVVLSKMPPNSPPIVIVQHMPPKFTESFANRLNTILPMEVCEAKDEMHLKSGHVYISPGDLHMTIQKNALGDAIIKLNDGDSYSGHKPSVDVLFKSVAQNFKNNVVAVILTGMGKDGAEGMKVLRDSGAYCIGQDEATSVVYGMPKSAFVMGGIEKELPLEMIPQEILKHCIK